MIPNNPSQKSIEISQNSSKKTQHFIKKTQKLKQKTQGFGKSTLSTCRKSVEKKPDLTRSVGV